MLTGFLAALTQPKLKEMRSKLEEALQVVSILEVYAEADAAPLSLNAKECIPLLVTRQFHLVLPKLAEEVDANIGHIPLVSSLMLAYGEQTGHVW